MEPTASLHATGPETAPFAGTDLGPAPLAGADLRPAPFAGTGLGPAPESVPEAAAHADPGCGAEHPARRGQVVVAALVPGYQRPSPCPYQPYQRGPATPK